MAVLSGSNLKVFGFSTPSGPVKDGSGNTIMSCKVSGDFSGTYAQADGVKFAGLGGAGGTIVSAMRNGKTPVLLSADFEAPGTEGGTPYGAITVALSTNDVTFHLTGSDMSTEHANAALGAAGNPIVMNVTFSM